MSLRRSSGLWLRFATLVLLVAPVAGAAQMASASFNERMGFAAAAAPGQARGSKGRSFAIEAAGGTLGSLLGFGAVYVAGNECEGEDLVCNLRSAFTAVVLGTVGSATGAYLAGRAFDTEPSALGATLGAVAGAAGAIGVVHLLTEELNAINGRGVELASYVVTQGLITALGSRIVRSLQ